METKLLYLSDSYKKTCKSRVVSLTIENNLSVLTLDQTVFYPFGGGQPSDQGVIESATGKLKVIEVVLKGTEVIHKGKIDGDIKVGDTVECQIDWDRRFKNMRVHSAGHIIHEAVKELFPNLIPIEGEHGKKPYIKYRGNLDRIAERRILDKSNEIILDDLEIITEFVTLEELKKRSPWIPEHLPTNKPLRIIQIGKYPPIPDGGTQVKKTRETIGISNIEIVNDDLEVYVYYKINDLNPTGVIDDDVISSGKKITREEIMNLKNYSIAQVSEVKNDDDLEKIRIDLFGKSGKFTLLTKDLKNLNSEDKRTVGQLINETKKTLEQVISEKKDGFNIHTKAWFDATIPGKKIELGKIHMVTKAIEDISQTFEKIGFTRVRYPEVEWDYYAFSALNFPENHPARDDWETFFVDTKASDKYGPMILTPHTSSGQIREMLSNKPPIRMINISRTFRRQIDVSHFPAFHQFEGLVVDKDISVTHLRGTTDYFAKTFFGDNRKTRLRPYHFQFTEPSFEVDISCNVCNGSGCKLCKEGWLELGGAGMVHPNVLKNCNIDSDIYSGFAFGWGVERTYMMKIGKSIPDLRLLYSSDLRILKQL